MSTCFNRSTRRSQQSTRIVFFTLLLLRTQAPRVRSWPGWPTPRFQRKCISWKRWRFLNQTRILNTTDGSRWMATTDACTPGEQPCPLRQPSAHTTPCHFRCRSLLRHTTLLSSRTISILAAMHHFPLILESLVSSGSIVLRVNQSCALLLSSKLTLMSRSRSRCKDYYRLDSEGHFVSGTTGPKEFILEGRI